MTQYEFATPNNPRPSHQHPAIVLKSPTIRANANFNWSSEPREINVRALPDVIGEDGRYLNNSDSQAVLISFIERGQLERTAELLSR